MDAKPLLAYISKYVNLSDKEQAILLSKITFRKYLKGQFVVQQGDVCRFENFVLSGCLKTFHVDTKG